jgi:WD repeat-containing protein 35
MYCTLFKKTPVHNTIKPTKISWNKKLDTLAIGGYEGFVKVQQIDFNKNKPDGTPVNPITMTQNLVHHKKKIVILYWNEMYDKLTTCDEEGVIIVWKYTDKGQWDTEMINNRDASFVTDLKWNKQGTYLCFIYDDGYSIVGTVEGSRLWGHEIRNKLYILEWSPDSTILLFGVRNNNILVYSATGYLIGEMEIESNLKNVQLVNLTWWSNPFIENNFSDHHLCLAFDNGWIQLHNDQNDNKPIKFKLDVNQIIKAEWNHSGTILAVAGSYLENTETKYSVFFFTNKGVFLKNFKISNYLTSFCWDKMSTKLAITTESLVLFTLVKPKYNWTFFQNTLVYSYVKEIE